MVGDKKMAAVEKVEKRNKEGQCKRKKGGKMFKV